MSELPDGWERTTIGELTDEVFKHRPEDRPYEEFLYVDISSIDNALNRITEARQVVGKDAPSRARQLLQSGDTVLSTVRTYLKNTAIVPPYLDGATASTGFSVLRPKPHVDPRFLFHRVLENGFVNQLSERQTGTSYPAVRDRDVRAMALTIPSLPEQQRIVEVIEERFSRLDAGVESLQRAKRNLTRFRRAAVLSAFDLEWPTEPLGEIAEVSGGIQKQPKRRPSRNPYPYLRVANVLRGELDLTDIAYMELFKGELERYHLEPGDLLIVEGNGSASQIGRSASWDGAVEDCVHQNHIIRARPSPDIDPRFLNLYWNSPTAIRCITQVAASTSGLYTLSTSKVKAVPVPVPPLDLQQSVVAEVERQFSIIDAMAKTIDDGLRRASTLRQSILSQAFSGKLTGAA